MSSDSKIFSPKCEVCKSHWKIHMFTSVIRETIMKGDPMSNNCAISVYESRWLSSLLATLYSFLLL